MCFTPPHSRNMEVSQEDILKVPELELMATSPQAGIFAVKSRDNRRFFPDRSPGIRPGHPGQRVLAG